MGGIDKELATVLRIPNRLIGSVRYGRIIENLNGNVESAFARVVREPKIRLEVVIVRELVAELDESIGYVLRFFGQSDRSPSTVIPVAGNAMPIAPFCP